jgi:abhydrolase domain-containing protein 17
MGNTIQRIAFPVPNPPYKFQTEPLYLRNKNRDCVPALYFPSGDEARNKKLIIFSHGNATDLAATEPLLRSLRDKLNCSVLGYEYLGYGHSTCESATSQYPSEPGCYESLRMAISYATNQLKYKHEQIYLMGQSIGCGPTCEMGQRSKIGGVILISPFRSAAQVVTQSSIASFFDFFKNDEKVCDISVPVLIIHGSCDNIIPADHSKHLATLCANAQICLIEGADHNDIWQYEEVDNAIQDFLEKC